MNLYAITFVALVVSAALHGAMFLAGHESAEHDIATACSSGNRQFVIDNNTFICGQLTHTTPDKLEQQRKEYYGYQCSRLFHGMENDFDER